MGDRTIDIVDRERARLGMTSESVAEFFRVSKQTYGNWKRRGMPAAMNARAADFMRVSVDELIGRAPARKAGSQVTESVTMYGYGVTEEGARLAIEWQKLDPAARAAIQTLIESMVAAQRRAERSSKAKPGVEPSLERVAVRRS